MFGQGSLDSQLWGLLFGQAQRSHCEAKALCTDDGEMLLSWFLCEIKEFKKLLMEIFKRCMSVFCHELSDNMAAGRWAFAIRDGPPGCDGILLAFLDNI